MQRLYFRQIANAKDTYIRLDILVHIFPYEVKKQASFAKGRCTDQIGNNTVCVIYNLFETTTAGN